MIKNQIKTFIIIFLPAVFITLQPDPGSGLVYAAFFFVLYRENLPVYYIAIGLVAIVLFVLTLAFGLQIVLTCSWALLLLFILYLQFYRKISLKFHWLKIVTLFATISAFIFSVDYVYNHIFEQRHRDRFNILLGKNTDTRGVGYNTNQSVLTIKSGGFSGKGYLQGDRTQGHFVPRTTYRLYF